MTPTDQSRRRFVAFLAGSPVFLAAGITAPTLLRLLNGSKREQSEGFGLIEQATQQQGGPIKSAAEALDVFDFEPVAKINIPPAHWGYLITGTDDDATIQANRDGYSRWALRPRRLVDVTHVDAS